VSETLLYEGKAKRVYETGEEGVLLHRYKDDATAFDGKKRGSWAGKGKTNATMSAALFKYLESRGVPTHFVGQPDETAKQSRGLTGGVRSCVVMLFSHVAQNGLSHGFISPALWMRTWRSSNCSDLEEPKRGDQSCSTIFDDLGHIGLPRSAAIRPSAVILPASQDTRYLPVHAATTVHIPTCACCGKALKRVCKRTGG
jgi:hypothetical protein